MIEFQKITEGLQTLLRDHPDLQHFNVTRGEYVNVDAANCPWIGVYRGDIAVEPRTLGHGARNWLNSVTLDVIVQVNGDGGEHTETLLGEEVTKVLNVITSDLTLGGEVEMVRSFNISFSYERTESNTLDFQWAIITLTAEARTS